MPFWSLSSNETLSGRVIEVLQVLLLSYAPLLFSSNPLLNCRDMLCHRVWRQKVCQNGIWTIQNPRELALRSSMFPCIVKPHTFLPSPVFPSLSFSFSFLFPSLPSSPFLFSISSLWTGTGCNVLAQAISHLASACWTRRDVPLTPAKVQSYNWEFFKVISI